MTHHFRDPELGRMHAYLSKRNAQSGYIERLSFICENLSDSENKNKLEELLTYLKKDAKEITFEEMRKISSLSEELESLGVIPNDARVEFERIWNLRNEQRGAKVLSITNGLPIEVIPEEIPVETSAIETADSSKKTITQDVEQRGGNFTPEQQKIVDAIWIPGKIRKLLGGLRKKRK